MTDISLDALKKRKCIVCGDSHKSFSNISIGNKHIATVMTCCNCGNTLTFAHSASEYARFLVSGDYGFSLSICEETECANRDNCPKIQRGSRL